MALTDQFCQYCGTRFSDGEKECSKCGAARPPPPQEKPGTTIFEDLAHGDIASAQAKIEEGKTR